MSLRIVLFKEVAQWTDDELERFVVQNRFGDVIDAEKALEGEHIARKTLVDDVDEGRQPRKQHPSSKERSLRRERRP